MFKNKSLPTLILVAFFLFPSLVFADSYLDGALLRAEGNIKVYLINKNIKRWVSSLEVFNFNNFKWQNVKVVSEKEVSAVKEGEPIVLESATPSAETPTSSTSPAPTASISPTPLPPPLPAKINGKLPSPEYIRADWLISHATINYGRIGQKIVFKYSDEEKDRIENFRLYEKKPGGDYFYKIADFEEISSIGCEDIDINGEWMLTEAGQCGYWSIQKIVPPGGRDAAAYLSAPDYLVGEYAYYVVGVDKDGAETPPSPKAKMVFLDIISVLNPIDREQIREAYPTFRWTVASGWPENSMADYFLMISNNKSAQSPAWTKQVKVSSGETERQFFYDGPGLNPVEKYDVNIYGHYRKSENEPDYISISANVPQFWTKKAGWASLFKSFFASIFRLAF